MAIDEMIDENVNIEESAATTDTELVEEYSTALTEKLLAADLYDANLGFFDRFENFLIFGEVKEMLDEFAEKNNLVDNLLRLNIFKTPQEPIQFFEKLNAEKHTSPSKKPSAVATAQVKSLFPSLTELLAIQLRQQHALKSDNAISSSITNEDKEKLESSLSTNALTQELIMAAINGIYITGTQEDLIADRRFGVLQEVQRDYDNQKPTLMSDEYLKVIAGSNFQLNDGYAFFIDERDKTFHIIDADGSIITDYSDEVIALKHDGDKAFKSFDEFFKFAKSIYSNDPQSKFKKYGERLTEAKKENIRKADVIHDNTENKLELLTEIAKRNFEIPNKYSIETSYKLSPEDNAKFAPEFYLLSENEQLEFLNHASIQPVMGIIVKDADGEMVDLETLTFKNKGDKLFEGFLQFEQFHAASLNDKLNNIVVSYQKKAEQLDKENANQQDHVPVYESVVDGMSSFLISKKEKQRKIAESELKGLPKRLVELEKLTKERNLLSGTSRFAEYNTEIELNRMGIESLKYSLYNEIIESYESILEDDAVQSLMIALENREQEQSAGKEKLEYFGDASVVLERANKAQNLIKENIAQLQEKSYEISQKYSDYLLYSTTCSSPVPQEDGTYLVYKGGWLDEEKMPPFKTVSFEEAKKWYAYLPAREDGALSVDLYSSISNKERQQLNATVQNMSKEEFDNAIFNNQLVHVSAPEANKTYNNFVNQVAQIEKFKENLDSQLQQEILSDINSGKIVVHENIYKMKDQSGSLVPIFNESESLVVSTYPVEEQQNILFKKLLPEKRKLVSKIRFNASGEMMYYTSDEYKLCFNGKTDKDAVKEKMQNFADQVKEKFDEDYLDDVIKNQLLLASEAQKLANQTKKDEATMGNENMVAVLHQFHPSKIVKCDATSMVGFLKNRKGMSYNEIVRAANAFANEYYKTKPRIKSPGVQRIVSQEPARENQSGTTSESTQESNQETVQKQEDVAPQENKKNENTATENQQLKKNTSEKIPLVIKKQAETDQPQHDKSEINTEVQAEDVKSMLLIKKQAEIQPDTKQESKSQAEETAPAINVADASYNIIKSYFIDTSIADIKNHVTEDDLISDNFSNHNYGVAEEFSTWFAKMQKEKGENLDELVKGEMKQLITEQPLSIKRFAQDTFANIISGMRDMVIMNSFTPDNSASLIRSIENKLQSVEEKGMLEKPETKNIAQDFLLKDFQETQIPSLIDKDNFSESLQDVLSGMRTVQEALTDADKVRLNYLNKKKQQSVVSHLDKRINAANDTEMER